MGPERQPEPATEQRTSESSVLREVGTEIIGTSTQNRLKNLL